MRRPEHFDPDCPHCTDLAATIEDLDAIAGGPIAHVRLAGYRAELARRLALHATVRHSPEASAVPMTAEEAAALDREDAFTVRLTGEIERIARRFAQAVAHEASEHDHDAEHEPAF